MTITGQPAACPACGTLNEMSAPMCNWCGTPLYQQAPDTTTFTTPPAPTDPPPPPPSQPALSVRRSRSRRSRSSALAGWWQRVAAMVLDSLFLAVPIAAATVWLVHADGTGEGWPSPNQLSFATIDVVPARKELGLLLAALALILLYFGVLNGSSRGATLGGALTGIAVRRLSNGGGLGLGRSLLRCLVRLVLYGGLPTLALITANRPPWVLAACASPGLLNDLRPLWDRQRRSFADSLAGSIVVRHRH